MQVSMYSYLIVLNMLIVKLLVFYGTVWILKLQNPN